MLAGGLPVIKILSLGAWRSTIFVSVHRPELPRDLGEYDTLRETLNIHEICVQIPPWSELIEGMEEQRLGAIITAIIYFPTVLMDETCGAQVMKSVSYSEYYFHNRKEFVFPNMEKDPVYKRRINEVVIELAELASRLDQLPKPS